MEQLVARQAHNLEVARSSPASATITSEVVETFSGFYAGQFSDLGSFPALLQRVGKFAVVLVVKVGVLSFLDTTIF